MIIDVRYHIASLAAVFLALGLGILIGMTMLGNDAIVDQQEKLTNKLESDLSVLRVEAKEAQAVISKQEIAIRNYEQFSLETAPVLVQDRLQGAEIAVIETNEFSLKSDFVNNLNLSGAKANSITSINNLDQMSDKTRRQIINYLGIQEQIAKEDLFELISTEIASGIRTGENFDFLTLLEDLELISLSGDYGVPINSVVLVGGSNSEDQVQFNDVDLPIIKKLTEDQVAIYGVENSNVAISYMSDYQKNKVPTVDNVDMTIGQVALVWSMDKLPGNYGIKETAASLLPQVQKVSQ